MAANRDLKLAEAANGRDFRFFWFSELLKKAVSVGGAKSKLSDLVFRPAEPYPEAVGIYIEHGWGKATEFVPWNRVMEIEKHAIIVRPPDAGAAYPPFVDQPGWMLLDQHLMGKTILDTDGRRVETVNDVHLLRVEGTIGYCACGYLLQRYFTEVGIGESTVVKRQSHLVAVRSASFPGGCGQDGCRLPLGDKRACQGDAR